MDIDVMDMDMDKLNGYGYNGCYFYVIDVMEV
jgi:hypothetical protein